MRRRLARVLAAALVTSAVFQPGTAADAEPAPTRPSSAPEVPEKQRPGTDTPLEAARKRARATGQRVEVPSLFTENAKVWANTDGRTLHAELHTTPIQVKSVGKDGADVWEPIDTTIVSQDGKLVAKRVKSPLEFGGKGSRTLVSAKDEDSTAGFAWGKKLPAPVLSGDQAVYRDAVAKGADLVVHAEADGFTQKVVLRERPEGRLRVELPMLLPKGMKYGKGSDGEQQLLSRSGKPESGPITVRAVDAMAERSPDSGKTGTVDATVEHTDGATRLVLQPDAAFLADPSVTYPVTMAVASEYVGAGLANDAWVNKNDPGLNHLTDTWLRVGTTQTSADIARIYLRFNVTGTPTLDQAKILNSDLMLWNYRSGAPAGSAKNCGLEVGSGTVARKLTSSWDPTMLSWTRQPTWTTTGQDANKAAYSDTTGCSTGELIYSIEQIVQSWANGEPDHGLVLMAPSETTIINWRQFRSQEGGSHDRNMPDHEPILFVQYEPAEVIATIREFPADQPVPPPLPHAEAKAWAAQNTYSDEAAVPGRSVTPEQALAQAMADGTSVDLPLMDAYLPEGLTDEEIEAGFEPEFDDSTEPPPVPNPVPTYKTPDKILNENPFFESTTGPWTVNGGTLDTSSERAHETSGVSSAKVVPAADATEVTVLSEQGIAVNPNYLHGATGWFYPVGADVGVQYGIDWFDGSGTLISSDMSSQTLARDTWSSVEVQEFPPYEATTARLRLTFPADPAAPVTLHADELKLLGPDLGAGPSPSPTPTPSPTITPTPTPTPTPTLSPTPTPSPSPSTPPVTRTVSLPAQTDLWLDNMGSLNSTGDTLWAGAWDYDPPVLERAYLKFDTSALAGKNITEAKLQLWNNESYGCGAGNSGIKAQRLTTAWSAGTLRWSNQPTATAAGEAVATDPAGCGGPDVMWNWTMTGIAQAWAGGEANQGLLLRGVDESNSAPEYERGFTSSRSTVTAQRPVLTVTYTEPGTTTPPSPSPTPSPTPPAGDTTPPTVVTVNPPNGGTTGSSRVVTARFSEPVTGARLTLTDMLMGTPVTGTTTMSADGTVLTFTASASLWSWYQAQVSGAKDATGNTMTPYSWSFGGAFTGAASQPATVSQEVADATPGVSRLRVRGEDVRDGQTVTSTTEPHLIVNVDDKLGRPSAVRIEVAHAPGKNSAGTGVIWTTTVSGVPSGSATDVRVPAGKLKKGWTTRWRARATVGASSGAWSEWRSLTVGSGERDAVASPASAAESESVAQRLRRVLPLGADNAKRVSYSECLANVKRNEYMRNRFAYCYRGGWVADVEVDGQNKGHAAGTKLVRIITDQNTRTIEVSAHIFVTQRSGELFNAQFKFSNPTVVDPATGGMGECRKTSSTGMTGMFNLITWETSTQDWHFTEKYTTSRADGANKIGSCDFTNRLTFVDLRGKTSSSSGTKTWTVRCDRSPLINYHNKVNGAPGEGGCVVMNAIPALTFGKNDINAKNVRVNEVYDHVNEALTNGGNSTAPRPGGRSFPDITEPKNIPGGSPARPLSRAKYSSDPEGNRGVAKAVCVAEYSKAKRAGRECDEFPFALTGEGAHLANPRHNFSVKPIDPDQNGGFGDVLRVWLSNNRMLRTDRFWVNLQ
ncbi:hypothetical protein DQ384_03685 [Sphaerisporangium album]|uniref:Uncharacterized protein n=1 Tax=Sphaerisporangium album TaxID=509200 RepID=A0A367FSP0_9ACTN|nr:DNRLRE domain-containing protein [Sphaerisporangium album]RCG32605.1 hypothetical protein DQ384_03685 [Sphaerisporangium album]